ncbi:MAG: hypothetical protein R6U17_05505 [Thermoplasmata archaeon]
MSLRIPPTALERESWSTNTTLVGGSAFKTIADWHPLCRMRRSVACHGH